MSNLYRFPTAPPRLAILSGRAHFNEDHYRAVLDARAAAESIPYSNPPAPVPPTWWELHGEEISVGAAIGIAAGLLLTLVLVW